VSQIKDKLAQLETDALGEIETAGTLVELDEKRVKFLGRKGLLTEILRGLKDLPDSERPAVGQAANELKKRVGAAAEERKEQLESYAAASPSSRELVDVTLPGRRPLRGHEHVVSQIVEQVLDIFLELGFQIATGPDIETEYYNFDSLNMPDSHPSRDLHDTFFVKPGVVLRTQTSPVQMRVMEAYQPPIAIVAPGRTYRVDTDASHSPMFFQIEGLLVDEGITFSDLKGTLMLFAKRLFGENTKTRFRPHYFPFTEPSAEMDVTCSVCKGVGCRICKYTGWLEVLGCGMVHPVVFRYAGYDYERFSGYAFGMGVDRLAMLKHAISGIHYLYENDLRFLEQF